MTDISLVIPKVKNLTLSNSWKVFYYQEYESFLFNRSYGFEQTLNKYCSQNFSSDFRTVIQVQSLYFLVGFFYSRKEIVVCSVRASRELALLKWLGPDHKNNESLILLENHVEKLMKLDLSKAPAMIEIITKLEGLPDLTDAKFSEIFSDTRALSLKLSAQVNSYRQNWFEKISDFGLNLTAKYSLFRIHILKFLAILPSLEHDSYGAEVKRVLLENLRRLLEDNKKIASRDRKNPEILPSAYVTSIHALLVVASVIPAFPLAAIIRSLTKIMAKRFIAGENIVKAQDSLEELKKSGRDATLDQLGELVVSEKEADVYTNEVLEIILGLKAKYARGERNSAGINRAHVSIKVSALASTFKPHAFDYTYSLVAPRLKKILLAGQAEDVFINIDAEHYHYRDLVFAIYKKVLLDTPELHQYKATGIVIQCYLRDGFEHLKQVAELARLRGITMPVRLVKGAYWDAETIEARAHGFLAPQFLNKEETDIHFRQMIYKVMELHPHLQAAVASHNLQDHCFAEILRSKMFPQSPVIEHQCLHMTYEALSCALIKMNWPTRNYVPVGNLLVGMAYLVRRIMENSSQVGILAMMRLQKDAKSIPTPLEVLSQHKSQHALVNDYHLNVFSTDFMNVGPVKLYVPRELSLFSDEFTQFKMNGLGKKFENAFPVKGKVQSYSCSTHPEVKVGDITFAAAQDAALAVEILNNNFTNNSWRGNAAFRAAVLVKASDLMSMQRYELAYLIVYESGKTIIEALGDVDEAIDFLNFYAREEMKWTSEIKRNHFLDSQTYDARGVIAVIAPWNFPLAIPCGMVSAALVAGNTVVLKSAEQTPLIAQVLVDLLHSAGVPKDCLIHLPGEGETVGKSLVEDPRVSGVVFTGSKNVGNWIYHRMNQDVLWEGSVPRPKKVIAEMGGKNAIIVTANAELDETVSGILSSAFNHAGQKCSAASRVIVDHRLADKLAQRLGEAVRDLKVGPAFENSTYLNPVINESEKIRLQNDVKKAVEEAQAMNGRVVIDRSQENFPGANIGPAVILLPADAAMKKISYACRELFGPVLHIIPFDGLDHAIEIFNCTEYALTGGIYGQSQDDIDYLIQQLEAGNIYVNRPNTGARVAIEPFGGMKMSGTGQRPVV